MKVKELITNLKKMPQHLEVGMVPFDEQPWVAGDWVHDVEHIIKDEHDSSEDERMFKDMPKEYVIIHG